jgi:hypothetical protein
MTHIELTISGDLRILLERLATGGTSRGRGSEAWGEAKRFGLVRKDINGNTRITRKGRALLAGE